MNTDTVITSATPRESAAAVPPPAALRALRVASVLGGLAQSLAGAAGALLAREVGGSDAVAGLPQALLVAGSAIAAPALSALTRRAGRRLALSAGLVVALVGSLVTMAGGAALRLPIVLAGSLLLGAGNTVVMLGRYAAADLVPQAARGRAMGAVLAATTVGAVAGPNLLAPAGGLAAALGLGALTGPYLVAAVAFAAAAATIAVGLRPGVPSAVDDPRLHGTAARRGPIDARGATGLAVLTVANLVMVGVMTMAPVHLLHSGSSLAAIGLVISLHIAGMFAPSPLSGWLTDRIGAARAAAGAGAVLTIAAGSAAVWAHTTVGLTAALVLLGVGWNLALLSGSALLTAGVPAGQRPRREGWGEVGMGVAAAGGGMAAGPVMAGGGYATLAAGGAIIAAAILPIARRRPERGAAAGHARRHDAHARRGGSGSRS
jgi:MFS family permease